jgi:hypothetical protein
MNGNIYAPACAEGIASRERGHVSRCQQNQLVLKEAVLKKHPELDFESTKDYLCILKMNF